MMGTLMKFDVLIIGGGLVGASLAAALKLGNLSVALVEAQPMSFQKEGGDGQISAHPVHRLELTRASGAKSLASMRGRAT